MLNDLKNILSQISGTLRPTVGTAESAAVGGGGSGMDTGMYTYGDTRRGMLGAFGSRYVMMSRKLVVAKCCSSQKLRSTK